MGKRINFRSNPVKICIKCGTILEPGINCHAKMFERSNYICMKCADKRRREWYKQRPEINRNHARSLRKQAVEILGSECVECGIDDMRCLQIDHINNDGYETRRDSRLGANTAYRWIIKNPDKAKEKYQLLCANHNWIKHFDFAYPEIK